MLASAGTQRRLISLNLGQYQTTASETLGRPIRFSIVVFRDGWNVRRKLNPWLLGGSKDVYVGRQVVWRVERAYPNKPDHGARTRIVAPYCNPAFWTARDLLSLAAVRRRIDDLWLRTQMNHVICLDHGVQCEGRTAFPLAPTAMAAMYNQRLLHHAIADNAAIAAPVERKNIIRDHACDVRFRRMPPRAVYRSVPVTETSMGCHTCESHRGRGRKILRSGAQTSAPCD